MHEGRHFSDDQAAFCILISDMCRECIVEEVKEERGKDGKQRKFDGCIRLYEQGINDWDKVSV